MRRTQKAMLEKEHDDASTNTPTILTPTATTFPPRFSEAFGKRTLRNGRRPVLSYLSRVILVFLYDTYTMCVGIRTYKPNSRTLFAYVRM